MDQCVTVERELEKVLQKFSGYGQLCERSLEELIQYAGGLRREILQTENQDGDLSGTISLVMTQCCKRIKDTVQKLASDHKDIHSSVSRVGKAIDKNFDSDISSVGIDGCWQADSQRILNEVMVEHFFRQGMLDVAEELCQESGLSIDQSQKEPFVELNRILEALKVRVLRPALDAKAVCLSWLLLGTEGPFLYGAADVKTMALGEDDQHVTKCHGLNSLVEEVTDALTAQLSHRTADACEDIQVLMGSLVYLRQGIENSPYVHLLDANQWADICDIFTRDACALLGLSVESPLSVSFSAGCVALPALINIKAVIEQRQCTGVWNQKDELPIEVDLGKKCWYHSIFACPILRQQTTDNNPPMKLVCGHIISRDALNKMFNGSNVFCSSENPFTLHQRGPLLLPPGDH
ncbi:Protein RMD5 A [Turdus rufiventris]|nr:Protein RMD5 A [Turdus rufiventris]